MYIEKTFIEIVENIQIVWLKMRIKYANNIKGESTF